MFKNKFFKNQNLFFYLTRFVYCLFDFIKLLNSRFIFTHSSTYFKRLKQPFFYEQSATQQLNNNNFLYEITAVHFLEIGAKE